MGFAGRKQRVLIIVENLPLPFDRRVWQQAKTLAHAGYTVTVICPTGKGYEERFEIIDDIAIYRHPLPLEAKGALGYALEYSAALWWEFRLAWKVLLGRGFDVIQACNPPDTIFLIGWFFKLLLRKRFIFDHHDINPELYIAKFGRKDLAYKLTCLLERMTFMVADYSIATNESYRRIAIGRGKMPEERVTVVRSGPSLERMRPLPPNPTWRSGHRYLVGYVGVMGKQEGVDHLLQAAKHLVRDRGIDVHFLIIGDGTEREALQEMSRSMGLADNVTFTGRIPDTPMLEALCTADVCVNPDIANEMNDKSTMNKIMEYMALGKPIVQYDLTEGRFSAQRASLYAQCNNPIDLGEKILFLLERPELCEEMGGYGRRRVTEELHWGIEAPKYLAVFERLGQSA